MACGCGCGCGEPLKIDTSKLKKAKPVKALLSKVASKLRATKG